MRQAPSLRIALALLLLPLPAAARTAGGRDTEMVYRQKFAAEQFDKLMKKMDEVADLLASTDPDAATAVRQAARQARTAFLAEDMDEVVKLLTTGALAGADRRAAEVIDELKQMLSILRSGSIDLDKRLEQIARWEKMLKQVDELIQREQSHEQASRQAAAAPQAAQTLAAAAERIKEILAAQQELLQDTTAQPAPPEAVTRLRELRDRLADQADGQSSLARATGGMSLGLLAAAEKIQREQAARSGKAGADLAAAAKDPDLAAKLTEGGAAGALAAASKAGGLAVEAMAAAAESLADSDKTAAGIHQTRAAGDLAEAAAALTGAMAALTARTGYDDLAGRQAELRDRTEKVAAEVAQAMGQAEAGADLQRAVAEMAAAAAALSAGDRSGATAAETEAIKALGGAAEKAASAAAAAAEKAANPDTAAQKREQDTTGEMTDKLLSDMEQAGKIDDAPTPGEASASAASESMDAASGNLAGGKPSAANAEQAEALEQLAKARRDLAEAIEQAAEQARQEMLVQIEQRLRAMLAAQQEINTATAGVFATRGDDGYARGEQLKLRALADRQGEQAAEADKVLELLTKEGTTAVFPAVLAEVRRDMTTVQELLNARQAGELTQTIGEQIARNLAELIEALQQEMSRGGGGSGGGGVGGGPLVSMLAELKMLRLMQLQINRRTVALNEADRAGGVSPDVSGRQHRLLSDRQRKVRDMTAELHEKTTPPPAEAF